MRKDTESPVEVDFYDWVNAEQVNKERGERPVISGPLKVESK